ncbi:potassium-transporting ATPase subunit C [Streptomyces sp. NPDC046939]|uniref:potassium-transporting ATPase subunit C n=1 Tax=Streptomyces sp. NPDC046939 TaxID=3155376 RepID=UPI0033F0A770
MHTSLRATGRLLGAGLRALLLLTVVCGVLYPLAVTGVAQAAFPHRANGSEITSDGKVVGSSLIGQTYRTKDGKPDLRWFQPRPSNGLGTNSVNTQYTLILSGATNLSGANPDLIKQIKDARAAVIADNSTSTYKVRAAQIPPDAVTSSGSGLDPHISPAYARLQTHRVADRNHLPVARVRALVEQHTEGRVLGFMGEPGVNVLELNVALRELTTADRAS